MTVINRHIYIQLSMKRIELSSLNFPSHAFLRGGRRKALYLRISYRRDLVVID